jgi:hypothetical protein
MTYVDCWPAPVHTIETGYLMSLLNLRHDNILDADYKSKLDHRM